VAGKGRVSFVRRLTAKSEADLCVDLGAIDLDDTWDYPEVEGGFLAGGAK
jgi:hypothetical protein